MPEYQVIARKFRPQRFKDVVSQDPIVITLKNAIRSKRLAQAYLFCGSRGTGKTTLARILAKAVNCSDLSEDIEPCNRCPSCCQITSSSSLDVLEIDGASNRGIEDIREISENVGYASSTGGYKIYLIDEVHMLTKEAFNALLKTLEEPPPKVLFFFATTEPHKLPSTILSRCQRFNLNRISTEKIIEKLKMIAQSLEIEADDEALRLLSRHAEGGLRDAESLFDQIYAFESGRITVQSIQSLLGLMSKEIFFELDQAGAEANFAKAFEITDRVFNEGKDLSHFIEGIIDHIRTILRVQLLGVKSSLLHLSHEEVHNYENAAKLYRKEQCISLIEALIEAQEKIRFSPSPKIMLESILLHILRSHFQISLEQIVLRLGQLEKQMTNPLSTTPSQLPQPEQKKPLLTKATISIDPTPTPSDYGKKAPTLPLPKSEPLAPTQPAVNQTPEVNQKPHYHYDTLLQFAAVELEGRLQKHV